MAITPFLRGMMKLDPIALSWAAAAIIAACAGVYFVIPLPDGTSGTAIAPKAAGPHGATAAPGTTRFLPTGERGPARARDHIRRKVEQDKGGLGVPPQYFEEASRLADETASRTARDLAVMEEAAYRDYSRSAVDPSQKLGLRLQAEPEVVAKLREILAEDLARRTEQRMAAERARLTQVKTLIDSDRAGYVNYLALEAMISRGHPLSGDQEAFHREFQESLEAGAVSPEQEREWYQQPGLLEEMGKHLSQGQQAELTVIVEEQEERERERQETYSRMRSGVIADRLGLDESERAALQQHLREHPDASREEIEAVLAPELRGLLPPGL